MKSPPRPPRPARPVTRPAKPPSKLVHAAKVRHHNKSALIRRESSRRRGAFGEEEDGVAAVPPFMIPTERAERWKTFIQCIVPWEPRRVEQEVVLGTRPLELPLPDAPGAQHVAANWHGVCMRVRLIFIFMIIYDLILH